MQGWVHRTAIQHADPRDRWSAGSKYLNGEFELPAMAQLCRIHMCREPTLAIHVQELMIEVFLVPIERQTSRYGTTNYFPMRLCVDLVGFNVCGDEVRLPLPVAKI